MHAQKLTGGGGVKESLFQGRRREIKEILSNSGLSLIGILSRTQFIKKGFPPPHLKLTSLAYFVLSIGLD